MRSCNTYLQIQWESIEFFEAAVALAFKARLRGQLRLGLNVRRASGLQVDPRANK